MNSKRKPCSVRMRVPLFESLEPRQFMSATVLSSPTVPTTGGTNQVTDSDPAPPPKTTTSDIVITKTLDRSSPKLF
jgi:hypothetical protein